MDPAVRETLQTLLTLVDERRHIHSQGGEAAKRRAADAPDETARIGALRTMDEHAASEREFKDLNLVMRAVIEEEFGASWEEQS